MTVRFEAEADNQALAFGMDVERAVKGEDVLPFTACVRHKCVVERVTRVVVTRMDAGSPPC
jgi:hypothetical protein